MKWLLRAAALLAFLSVAAAAARFGFESWMIAPGPAPESVTLLLPKGIGSAEIGRRLGEAGLIERPQLFAYVVKLSAKLLGRAALQAGEYAFPAHASLAQILDQMRRGQVVVHRLTIPEGLTVQQIDALMQAAPGLMGGQGQKPAEGTLLPTTFYYHYGDEREGEYARMQRALTEAFEDLWAHREPNPLIPSRREAVILASIIEKETAIPDERGHVAAVFLNRLRQHMRLQSDATVLYGLSQGSGLLDHALSHADLQLANAYNSYLNDGLPPGPICNPGLASLKAALHPDQSADLYFVADGSGGHVFAKTLVEHNQNVTRLRRLEQGKEAPPAQKKERSAR